MLVHGKSTLEYGTEVPHGIRRGSRVRFHQEIALELSAGEYAFEVGLAAVDPDAYVQRARLAVGELAALATILCMVPQVGQFLIVMRRHGLPVQLLHHGVANLPGSCEATVVPAPGA